MNDKDELEYMKKGNCENLVITALFLKTVFPDHRVEIISVKFEN